MSDIALELAGKQYPLKLTMHRTDLIEELTGVDVLGGGGQELGSPKNLSLTLYALAGGKATGMSVTEFKDELTPATLRVGADLLVRVFKRDAGGGEGNAPADAPTS